MFSKHEFFICPNCADVCGVNQYQSNILKALLSQPEWNEAAFVLRSGHDHEYLVGLGEEASFEIDIEHGKNLEDADNWLSQYSEWTFGYLSYDLKNKVEDLSSRHLSKDGFGLMKLVRPRAVIRLKQSNVEMIKGADLVDFSAIQQESHTRSNETIRLTPRLSKPEYVEAIHQLQKHIQRGDIYEINFCQEFYAHAEIDNALDIFFRLNALADAPFECLVLQKHGALICASPERFLQKKGTTILSQPIKGTSKRSTDAVQDQASKHALRESEKEQAENVMIVDLVRNDLSRIAQKGSVKVDELFGVYSFKTVHHLVSTVSAQVAEGVSFSKILQATFPMGSMTGAPKIMAMKLADQYESSRRGLYSGSVGYIAPNGDFDFNVVIRSLIYNAKTQYVTCHVGGAITSLSKPDSEYEECLLKAEAIMRSLQTTSETTAHA
jgi:para-aminobenzoate synthetase component 1